MLISPSGSVTSFARDSKLGVLNMCLKSGQFGVDVRSYPVWFVTDQISTMNTSTEAINTTHSNNYIEIIAYKHKTSTSLMLKVRCNFGPETLFYTGSTPTSFSDYYEYARAATGSVNTGNIGYFIHFDYSPANWGTIRYYVLSLNNNSFSIAQTSDFPRDLREFTCLSSVATPASLTDIRANLEESVESAIDNLTTQVSETISEVNSQMSQVTEDLDRINNQVLGTQAKIKSSYVSR